MLAGVLSSCFAKKKVAKEEGDPKVGALRVPCATRQTGRLAKLACGSDNASRRPPARLRCSAPSTGTRKASTFNRFPQKIDSHGQPEKTPKNEISSLVADALPGPLEGAEQRRGWRIKGEDGWRGAAPSSAAPASAE